jgi:UPF0755 protein
MKFSLRSVFAVVIITGWILFGLWFGSFTLSSPERQKPVTIEIAPKSSLSEIGDLLKKHKIIRETYFFRTYAVLSGKYNLKPGIYTIQPGTSLYRVLQRISEGKQDVVSVVLPPGFTTVKLADRLKAHGYRREEFLKLMNVKKPKYDFEKLIPHDQRRMYRLEGYLFPANYKFQKFETVEDLINDMLKPMHFLLKKYRVQQQLKNNPLLPRGMTLDQLITVASLIEREAQVKSELPVIAGVIYNRMRNPENNKLMIDATVVYIYGLKGRNLTSINQKQIFTTQHPYNTYIYKGLPPGPIAFPSKAAILAALHPEKHDYEFYVTRKDDTNRHYFAKTYEEHVYYNKKSSENEKKVQAN